MKNGDWVYTNIKIVNVYKTQAESDSARTIAFENAEKMATEKAAILKNEDDKAIANFIAKNNTKAIRITDGVYIETIKRGNGPFLNNRSIVKIKYTGTTLAGVMFDSNIDSSKGHTDPLAANLTKDKSIGNGVIPGLEMGLLKLQVGSKVKIYIPSGLAYGPRGAGVDLPPNSNLIFYIEVIKVLTKGQFKAENIAAVAKEKREQKRKEAEQKKYMDALKKSDPKKYEDLKQKMIQEQMSQLDIKR